MKKIIDIKNVDFMICEIVIQSQSLNGDMIRTIDPTPLRGIGDRDLESQYASSPDSQNAKARKRLMHKAVVTALGHISERWRKELEKPSCFLGIASGNDETHGHTNVELSNVEFPK